MLAYHLLLWYPVFCYIKTPYLSVGWWSMACSLQNLVLQVSRKPLVRNFESWLHVSYRLVILLSSSLSSIASDCNLYMSDWSWSRFQYDMIYCFMFVAWSDMSPIGRSACPEELGQTSAQKTFCQSYCVHLLLLFPALEYVLWRLGLCKSNRTSCLCSLFYSWWPSRWQGFSSNDVRKQQQSYKPNNHSDRPRANLITHYHGEPKRELCHHHGDGPLVDSIYKVCQRHGLPAQDHGEPKRELCHHHGDWPLIDSFISMPIESPGGSSAIIVESRRRTHLI